MDKCRRIRSIVVGERGLEALKALAIEGLSGARRMFGLVIGHAVCEADARKLADELQEDHQTGTYSC